ncbi:MAG: peroxiredoxin [Candidatus Zixiibacteriota bacterium]
MHRIATILAVLTLLAGGTLMSQTQSAAPALLKVGDQIPQFKLPYATRDTIVTDGIGSQDLLGHRYLIAFYPADWSGGCTKEMCTFRDEIKELEGLNIEVYPVSADLVYSHHEWAKNLNLPFKLLADQWRDFGKAMGVYVPEKGWFKRSVFVVGPDGKIQFINYDYSVKDDVHLKELKAFLAKK